MAVPCSCSHETGGGEEELTLVSAGTPQPATQGGDFRPFTFVHISDPHLGFSARADARFARLVGQINRIKPDFVVLTGDLTYGLTDKHMAAIDAALKQFEMPVKLIPGNHDVRDHKSLRIYRKKYGSDYYVFTHDNCDFIFLDSMILDPDTPYFSTKDSKFHQELDNQWNWLEKALADARLAGRRHVFLLLHIPPFTDKPDDRATLAGICPAGRKRLLAMTQKYGVEVILAGHIHRTIEVQADQCTVLTVGGTYWPLDSRGYGFRLFKVEPGGIYQKYIDFSEFE